MENNNLPMKVNNNLAPTIENKRQVKRIIAGFKKIGKITLNGLVAVAGLSVSAVARASSWYARYGNICSSDD